MVDSVHGELRTTKKISFSRVSLKPVTRLPLFMCIGILSVRKAVLAAAVSNGREKFCKKTFVLI
jgi:hypothetical protein